MKVAVIGAGASGLIAAYIAAKNGATVTLYEKNEKCGKKIYITGKGRCNVTNDVEPNEFLQNVVSGAKFLNGSIWSFSPANLISLLEDGGLPLKTERGNRVFPLSDKASDVTKCLENYCKKAGVVIEFNTEIQNIEILNGTMRGIIINNSLVLYDKVIVCTGGLSYPSTGSTGDGYRFAQVAGHSLVAQVPSLCGFNVIGSFYKQMQGLSLKNVSLSLYVDGALKKDFFGEMLFTHFGISGPIVLTASALCNRLDCKRIRFVLDFKPALTFEQLDKRLLSDFAQNANKSLYNCLRALLPVAVIAEVLKRSQISGEQKVNVVTKQQRNQLINVMKGFEILVSSLRGFEEAIVTAGGINLKEINPKTMESKLVKGLYFCGEVLDCDAFTGGFNLQIAFSTGYAAGNAVMNNE